MTKLRKLWKKTPGPECVGGQCKAFKSFHHLYGFEKHTTVGEQREGHRAGVMGLISHRYCGLNTSEEIQRVRCQVQMWSRNSWFVLEREKKKQTSSTWTARNRFWPHVQTQGYPSRAAELHLYNDRNHREASQSGKRQLRISLLLSRRYGSL